MLPVNKELTLLHIHIYTRTYGSTYTPVCAHHTHTPGPVPSVSQPKTWHHGRVTCHWQCRVYRGTGDKHHTLRGSPNSVLQWFTAMRSERTGLGAGNNCGHARSHSGPRWEEATDATQRPSGHRTAPLPTEEETIWSDTPAGLKTSVVKAELTSKTESRKRSKSLTAAASMTQKRQELLLP